MEIKAFSPKQLTALSWWRPGSPHRDKDAIICDGAVRSGKTMCLSLSFLLWAMTGFSGEAFALCGKTVNSLRRNLLLPLCGMAAGLGMRSRERMSQSLLEVEWRGGRNRFYLFGGGDEGAAARIQGVTLAGILFDEAALMPRSFVEQGLARCSGAGARFWFSCNPGHPQHWFHTEWIRRPEEKNALYLHFVMEDNPAITGEVRERYERLYSGVFHERYVLGKWVGAHGVVYPMFDARLHVVENIPMCGRYVVSCDYGTVNPASFGLWGEADGIWYRAAEFYHDSRRTGRMLTDEEYADELEKLAEGRRLEAVVADPSAASFLQCLRRRGKYPVLAADNRVMDGIRYFCMYALGGDGAGFCAASVERR